MRCEGWRRTGGAFTFGPVEWKQCESKAIIILEVKQEKVEKLPACKKCWKEAIQNNIEILSVVPV